MNILYKKYLEGINVLQEEEFNKILEILPTDLLDQAFTNLKNDGTLYGYFDSTSDIDDVASDLVNLILQDIKYVYCEDFTISEASMYISDVDSLEDLEEIKNRFPKITISNYNDLKEWIFEEEKENLREQEYIEKKKLLTFLGEHIDIETLRKLAKSFGKNDKA